MLKLETAVLPLDYALAATFGWLCVETMPASCRMYAICAATFGWLCVETLANDVVKLRSDAATFGWLCVETISMR